MSCADLSTAAGTTIAVSATAALTPWDAAAYAVPTYTEIGNVSSISEFGKTYAIATFKPLASRTTCKRKGSYDCGGLTLGIGYAAEDAGFAILQAALDSDASYTFKITVNDATDALDIPTVVFFMGQVKALRQNPGSDPDAFLTATCEIEIDGDYLTIPRHVTP